jgi:proteasome-associated ATPase
MSFLYFDDIDQLGARGESASTAIDSRVLPAFLSEIDGLEALGRVTLIGSTNRPDLLDEALLRSGRFGDKVFRIPRPNREAAREIFRKHLSPDLPYQTNGNGGEPTERMAERMAEQMIEAALSSIYSPGGENHTLATLAFRDGSRKPLKAAQVMSGALISNAVREAKERSCRRALKHGPVGISAADLLAALDRQLSSIAQRLKPGPALQQMLELPQDLDVVKVEAPPRMKGPSI